MRLFYYFICATFVSLSACTGGKLNLADDSDFEKIAKLDVPMPPSKAGDWLSIHAENGQTFEQYLRANPVEPTTNQKTIYILPIGDFSPLEDSLTKHTAEYIGFFFGLKTTVLPALSTSVVPVKYRRKNPDEGHEQFQTTYILDSLVLKRAPSDALVTMAITNIDLFPSAAWNFVFGQAYTHKRAGVSSFFRYKKGALHDSTYAKTLERLISTSSHEIGHAFSIKHCTHAVCVMNGSNSLEEADSRPNLLCSVCLRKLYWNLEFNNTERLQNLQAFFKKHHLTTDYQKITQVISSI
ncbi:MAG: hypothetical protein RI894_686 [Bacteroidota bacterium]|jgi:archaemetzincin